MAIQTNRSSILLFTLVMGFMIQSTRDPVHTGLWIVLAIFFGFGLIAQILVVNGIMQITPVNQMPRTPTYRAAVDYRNYQYHSIVAKINSSGVTVTTVDEAIRTYSSLFNVGEKAAKPFFQNQFVMSTLGLSIQDTPQVGYQSESSNQKSEKVSSNFWGSISDGAAKNEAKSDAKCAGQGCSNSISAFDFRCYKCRERFCESCKGSGLTCPSCS
jgi:hypothetical protein